MIQRIQSVYLLIAVALQAMGLFLNWATYVGGGAGYVLSGLQTTVEGMNVMPLTLGLGVAAALLLATLLKFKNRKSQMRFANVAIIQLALVFGLFGIVHYQIIEALKASHQEISIGYGVAVAIPVISIILVWLAKKAIKKDEDLVKSVDRLR